MAKITFRDNDGGGPYTVKTTKKEDDSYKAMKKKQSTPEYKKAQAAFQEKMKEPGMTHDKAWEHATKEHQLPHWKQ